MGVRKISELNEGDILEKSVSKDGQILIPAGFYLKKEYISLLGALDITQVFIKEDGHDETTNLLDQDTFQSFVISIREILGKYIYKSNKILYPVIPMSEELVSFFQKKDNTHGFLGENRRADLYEHTIMVSSLCVYLGILLGINQEKLLDLAVGGLLHDLGLRFVTTSFDQFSEENCSPLEMYELKKHTILAYTVLDGENWISDTSKKMILSHHERIDGSGYPLKQKKMDTACRIIQVCDAYDSMVSGMECERKKVSDTLDYLKNNSGIKFDSQIVDLFLSKVIL